MIPPQSVPQLCIFPSFAQMLFRQKKQKVTSFQRSFQKGLLFMKLKSTNRQEPARLVLITFKIVKASPRIKLTLVINMYNSRISVGSKARENSRFKSSLGNTAPRYHSEVTVQRRKYLISSTRNSQDVPEWMSRTNSFHFRQNNQNRSMFTNANSGFKNVEQTYVYAHLPKAVNPQGQFNRLVKPRVRSKWEMKNHTFEFKWPQPESEIKRQAELKSRSELGHYQSTVRPGSRQNEIMRFEMAKYGYFESPLHRQKDTPIKIGHPYLLNTTYVQ